MILGNKKDLSEFKEVSFDNVKKVNFKRILNLFFFIPFLSSLQNYLKLKLVQKRRVIS